MNATLFAPAHTPNALSIEERNALVLSCTKLCRSLAKRAAFGVAGVDAEDLEQEALVACVEAAKRWLPDQGSKFSTYAVPCIQRHLANLVTRFRCEANIQIDEWESITDPRSETDADETDSAAVGLTPQQSVAMSRLPEQMRAAVLLVLQGFGPDRIAERLGQPVKDVKLILRNAEKQLRKDLAWVDLPGLFGIDEEFRAA
jgi:RNA polymerase sigma factor (sigma-70 family)